MKQKLTKESVKPKRKATIKRKSKFRFDSFKIIGIVWAITIGIWGVGGKMIYDQVQTLVVEQRETHDRIMETKKEIMAISNFVAATDVRIEAVGEWIDNNRKRIDDLYKILNR